MRKLYMAPKTYSDEDCTATERKAFLDNIITRRLDQKVFYKGWMNRVNSFQFKA